MKNFKIRLSKKSTEILKQLAPTLMSSQGAGALIAKREKKNRKSGGKQ